jgi:predicted O-methyltransferase YrrM
MSAAISTSSSSATVRGLLEPLFGPLHGGGAFARAGMALSELVILYDLVARENCERALEIGMASGGSSVVICAGMQSPRGRLLSIDPFQTSDYQGSGVRHVAMAGFAERHRLVEDPDYLALPSLVRERQYFDFVFIDGWHSFDYVMLDIFYADLLLKEGGVLAFHDTDWPPVYKAIRFLEQHRPYVRLSPPPAVALRSIPARLARRLKAATGGKRRRREARERRLNWRTLSAYRKTRSELTPQSLAEDF